MSQSSSRSSKDKYRHTVFLPRSSFPMRGQLPKAEPKWLERWKEEKLDEKLEKQAHGRPIFTLHDGPPYANGHLHIGHALNKINKDVVNRAHRMLGYGVHYIPGWDCHGLPIEWKVEERYRKAKKNKDDVPIIEFREECRRYARHWMDIQMEEFQRLGVQAQWQDRYVTMDFKTEAAIEEQIGKFLHSGRLYRGLRPVMWSPVEKTALAEAEVEYKDKNSTAIYVSFPVKKDPTKEGKLKDTSIVIWTTTPWTIPANKALAYGPNIDYVVINITKVGDGSLVKPGMSLCVAQERLDSVCQELHIADYTITHHIKGNELAGCLCRHPLCEQGFGDDVPMFSADFVTTDAGTGFVHMAPAHGEDDFFTCVKHGIDIPEIVQANGVYASWLPLFAGIHVFKATDPVCDSLIQASQKAQEENAPARGLMGRQEIVHSYPHSWRSHAPIIFRATAQWFIRMDGEKELRQNALNALKDVTFIPARTRNRLTSMIADRPDWCISRQRAWGVPIAVFLEKETGQVLRDEKVTKRIVDIFKVEGADAWYNSDPSRFLGDDYDPKNYDQVFDIVDVWFESGASYSFVLNRPGLNFPADLYLEGSDQHRGWFQSSLLESVATKGVSPYKTLLTNGFVLDEHGRKMSKSLGNVISPHDVAKQLGVDVLRLWVVNSDAHEDLRIGKDILKQQSDLYRRLRNSLRWILGGLDGFSEDEKVPYDELPSLEKWVLHRLYSLSQTLRNAVQTHEWTGVYPLIHMFCTTDLSAFYFDIRKDVLYCDGTNSLRRRAVRTVLDILHRTLVTWLAPVLVFTAEEAWRARFGDEKGSVHEQSFFDVPAEWHDEKLGALWEKIRNVRKLITTEIETARREGKIGSSLQAQVELTLSEEEAAQFKDINWADLCIVSHVDLEIDPNVVSSYLNKSEDGTLHGAPVVRIAQGHKCARCWKVLPEVGQNEEHPDLCHRCVDVVSSL